MNLAEPVNGVGTGGRSPLRRRYHYHFPGLLYIGVTLFLALGAFNSGNNLLYLALGLAIGGLVVSGVVSGAALMGVRVERLPIAPVNAGEVAVFRYRVTNVNRISPVFALTIEEEPAGKGGDWHESFSGIQVYISHLGPGRTVYVDAIARARSRGPARFTGVRAWSTFPFGLARKSVTADQPDELLVRPMAIPLGAGVLDRAVTRAGRGAGAEKFPGRGDEFYGLREYSPGDSTARIAWRSTARTGQVIVRQHSMQSPTRLWVVLDLAAEGPAAREARERAIVLAASVLRAAFREGIAVGLDAEGPGAGAAVKLDRRHLEHLLDRLARIDASAPPPAAPPARAAQPRNSGIVVVHAGDGNRDAGPSWALRLAASSISDYTRADALTRAALDSVVRRPSHQRAGARNRRFRLPARPGKGNA